MLLYLAVSLLKVNKQAVLTLGKLTQVNQVNRTPVLLLLTLSIVLILPSAFIVQPVYAQPDYTIQKVSQTVEVMYSGHTVISYVISINGQLPSAFQIGLPSNYSTLILNSYAFDEQNNTYQVELGTQLGNQTGFYAAQVDINNKSPQVLTLILILSNSLLAQNSNGYTLTYPAYPGLTQSAVTCNVTLKFPIDPVSISIAKSDGNVNSLNYSAQNLAAFTNQEAIATFQLASGYLQQVDIKQLDRQVTVNPTGTVTATDIYHITNNSPSTMGEFIFSLPTQASNVIIKDSLDKNLTTAQLNTTANSKLIHATLSSTFQNGQSTVLTAQYSLPSATIQGTTYTLTFNQFPYTNYYIDTATLTFNPPEGAVIIAPLTANLDSSTSITRNNYQESLIITQQGISFVNYQTPNVNTLQIAFDYNTIWSSFRPVIIVLSIAIIGSIAIIIWRKYKSTEKKQPTLTEEKEETVKSVLTPDFLRNFTDIYEERKQITSEIASLDAMAKKGKIQRQQYKSKKRELETRHESLNRRIEESKQTLRSSGSSNAELIRQIDKAELDLNEVEGRIKAIEARKNSQQITIEEYKKSSSEYQRQKDKAESTINGILLRLREKAR